MAATTVLETAARNAACDAIVDLLDAHGNILWATALDATVAETSLSATAFGASAVGVATLADTPLDSGAAVAGTVTQAKFRTAADAVMWTNNVGTADTAIILSNNVLANDDVIRLTSYTFTVPSGA